MERARRWRWWVAVPIGVALGFALAVGLDRAAAPAGAQAAAGVTVSAQQLHINQRISQQAVRRANRANRRLDELQAAATGPAGPQGPPGPAGPGATRISWSAPAGTPAQVALAIDGLTIRTACEAGAGGETNLVITSELAGPGSLVGTATIDGGTDPNNPPQTNVANFQNDLPAGTSQLGTLPAADGSYFRVIANALLLTPTRTASTRIAELADGIADRCSFTGVAVTS
jgi:hypothetical protein